MASPGHSQRATRALQSLAEADPAFAALSLWCHHTDAPAEGAPDTENDPPAWTDGRTIYYGPSFAQLDLGLQIGTAAHQILHVAFRHVPRSRTQFARFGADFDARLFTMATDALVNETLILAGYLLPRPCLLVSDILTGPLQTKTSPEQAIASWDVERLYLALLQQNPGPSTQSSDGEGQNQHRGTGAAEEVRHMAQDAGFADDLDTRRADPGGPAAEAQEEIEWRQRLTRALHSGQSAGRGLGAIGLRIADIPKASIRWERRLRRLLAPALDDQPRTTWQRPNRIWVGMEAAARSTGLPVPMYQPGVRRDHRIPRVAVGLDASSSIDTTRLHLFLGQLVAIAGRVRAEVHLIVFDEAVRVHRQILHHNARSDLQRLDLPRGGGTDFGPMFDAARGIAPSATVLLTDLDATVPQVSGLRGPIIWAVPEVPRTAPPFGDVLLLDR